MAKKKLEDYHLFIIFAALLTLKNCKQMNKESFLYKVFDLYYDGFRHMTLGKTLWTIIIVKLAIIFLVLKLFFFPDFLKTHAAEGQESDYVANELLNQQ